LQLTEVRPRAGTLERVGGSQIRRLGDQIGDPVSLATPVAPGGVVPWPR
jgi:hypothetical protein